MAGKGLCAFALAPARPAPGGANARMLASFLNRSLPFTSVAQSRSAAVLKAQAFALLFKGPVPAPFAGFSHRSKIRFPQTHSYEIAFRVVSCLRAELHQRGLRP